jgi:colanic acid/amylovoran biosynthesis glycosyltransferase
MNITIVQALKDATSETFLRAHADHLPGSVHVMYGGAFPSLIDDGRPLVPYVRFPLRAAREIARVALRAPPDYWAHAAFRKFLRRSRADVVLAESGPIGVAVMNDVISMGMPLVVHFHGVDAYDSAYVKGPGLRYPALFECAAAIIAVSRDMERQLLSLGAPREKLHYNCYGISKDMFQGARPAVAEPRFLAVGRLVDKKAPLLTLLAFREVLREVANAELIVVGDGPLREACQQLSDALQLGNHVTFTGFREHGEVAELMRTARAFVQHSVRTLSGDSEGTPVAILEAQASGLPVIATRHAGIIDVVVEGETGLLCDERDVPSMAANMIRLARDPQLAQAMGAAGREHVMRCHSMEQSIAGLERILSEAVRGGCAHSSVR